MREEKSAFQGPISRKGIVLSPIAYQTGLLGQAQGASALRFIAGRCAVRDQRRRRVLRYPSTGTCSSAIRFLMASWHQPPTAGARARRCKRRRDPVFYWRVEEVRIAAHQLSAEGARTCDQANLPKAMLSAPALHPECPISCDLFMGVRGVRSLQRRPCVAPNSSSMTPEEEGNSDE